MATEDDLEISPHQMISPRVNHRTSFTYAESTLICSSFIIKKARGRKIKTIFSASKKRWFELRCDDSKIENCSYALYYFVKKGDLCPKGVMRLSGLDSLSLDKDYNIIYENEADKETSHHTLVMTAADGDITQMWIDALQDAIGDLNRLTMIREEDEDSIGQRSPAVFIKKSFSEEIRAMSPPPGADASPKFKKLSSFGILGFPKRASAPDEGYMLNNATAVPWDKISANGEVTSCGKALIYAIEKETEHADKHGGVGGGRKIGEAVNITKVVGMPRFTQLKVEFEGEGEIEEEEEQEEEGDLAVVEGVEELTIQEGGGAEDAGDDSSVDSGFDEINDGDLNIEEKEDEAGGAVAVEE